MMNAEIETIFAGFTVDNVEIPVAFKFYEGDDDAWIVYSNADNYHSYSGDDDLLGYVTYYDFEIYSKGNYIPIVEAIKEKLTANGFMWVPSRSSGDMYEDDTRYYHKTLSFSIERSTQNG